MGAVHLVQRDNLGEGRLEAGEPAFDHELGHQQDLAVALGGVRVETLVKRVHLETERAPLDQSIHRLPRAGRGQGHEERRNRNQSRCAQRAAADGISQAEAEFQPEAVVFFGQIAGNRRIAVEAHVGPPFFFVSLLSRVKTSKCRARWPVDTCVRVGLARAM